MKYWRMKLKGKRSAAQIESAIGATGGQVLRIHTEGDETQVYFAADKSMVSGVAKSVKKPGKTEEVSAKEVKRLA